MMSRPTLRATFAPAQPPISTKQGVHVPVAQPKLSLWGRGALHRHVVYQPNVQEETLTAEAADSPDFTLYSESCTNHVLLRFSYSTQNGARVHQLLTPAGRSHRAETLCPSPLGR